MYKDTDPQETREWIESIEDALEEHGYERTQFLLQTLISYAQTKGSRLPFNTNTPYINTILPEDQVDYPGDLALENNITSILRWNAMAMVTRANSKVSGIGGHISTYASAATLYEVAFNHFFKGVDHPNGQDLIFFQGHASPGIYARAFLEGRLSQKKLDNFRQELSNGGGLSSYPHPYLMPDFWQFATVSMGLGPIMGIYQARFMRYMIDRGFIKDTGRKVFVYTGDGEMDEPESLGALTLASRENLDNLIFVVNCNLQRLDGPVRGNSKLKPTFSGGTGVTATRNLAADIVQLAVSEIKVPGTNITYSWTGMDTGYNKQIARPITENRSYYPANRQIVASEVNQDTQLSGGRTNNAISGTSANVSAIMTSTSSFLTPVLDSERISLCLTSNKTVSYTHLTLPTKA